MVREKLIYHITGTYFVAGTYSFVSCGIYCGARRPGSEGLLLISCVFNSETRIHLMVICKYSV